MHSQTPNPCPRCDREMQRVEWPDAAGACSKPFSCCIACKQNWQDEELAEAREAAGVCDDIRQVFFEETRRGDRRGGSSASPPRKKSPRRGHSDWNLEAGWTLERTVTQERRTKRVIVRFPAECTAVCLCRSAGVKVSDLVRNALAAAFLNNIPKKLDISSIGDV